MTYPHVQLRCLALGTAVILASWGSGPAHGAEANFWIANNNNGPQTPLIEVLVDTSASIDIWARPEPGMTLGGFSLNLDSSSAGLISFDSVYVLNPGQPARNTARHQLVFDTTITWNVIIDDLLILRDFNDDHLEDNRIEGFMGATFVNNSDLDDNGAGIGPECGDSECMLIGGEPAWKVATVNFEAGGTLGSTELYLEIGEHGIWHMGESTASTTALFGDPGDGDPEDRHAWTPLSTGGHTGLPDAIIQVVSQLSDADFDDNGQVNGGDFLIWQRGFGEGDTNSEGDANFDDMVDDMDLLAWESQYGSNSAGLIAAVPEPSSIAFATFFLGLVGLHLLGRH